MNEWIATPESSNLNGFGYDKANQILIVEFASGGRYEYTDVEQSVFKKMKSAKSKGKYVHSNIKNNYKCNKI